MFRAMRAPLGTPTGGGASRQTWHSMSRRTLRGVEAAEDEVEDESVVSVIFAVCVWGERRKRDGRIGRS